MSFTGPCYRRDILNNNVTKVKYKTFTFEKSVRSFNWRRRCIVHVYENYLRFNWFSYALCFIVFGIFFSLCSIKLSMLVWITQFEYVYTCRMAFVDELRLFSFVMSMKFSCSRAIFFFISPFYIIFHRDRVLIHIFCWKCHSSMYTFLWLIITICVWCILCGFIILYYLFEIVRIFMYAQYFITSI